ncbi:MAG: hypothetical protein ACKV2V_31150 [Blastocatellia bacterium]
MPESLEIHKTDLGWAAEMPTDMAEAAGAAPGSIVVLHLHEAGISAEILPPVSAETKQRVRDTIGKFSEAFAEMKRLGD